MSSAICGTTNLKATSDLQQFTVKNLTLGTRTFDTVIESCYWYITADTKQYHDDAEIYIYLDATSTASMYVFAGNDRRNAT